MQITVNNGSGDFTLCHGSERRVSTRDVPWLVGPADLSVDGIRKEQVADYLRSARAGLFDRGNVIYRIVFSCRAEFANRLEAHFWRLRFPVVCPGSGVLVLSEMDAAGSKVLCSYARSVVTLNRTTSKGVSVHVSFNITAGDPTIL